MRANRFIRGVVLVVAMAAAAPVTAQPGRAPARGARVKVDVDKARAALVGSDHAAALEAAGDLGKTRARAAHVALLDALATGLHPEVAAVAIDSLAAAPHDDDLVVLAVYARYRDGAVRAAAVRALGQRGKAGAVLAALHDQDERVRGVAADAVRTQRLKGAIDALLILLDKGEAPAALALGALADLDVAQAVAEHLGTAPDAMLAQALGAMLLRKDFGPEGARVQVVRTIIKLAGVEAITALSDYVDATPPRPPRQSRREAEAALKAKLGGE